MISRRMLEPRNEEPWRIPPPFPSAQPVQPQCDTLLDNGIERGHPHTSWSRKLR